MRVSQISRQSMALVAVAALMSITGCGGDSSGDLAVWHELAGSGNTAANDLVAGFNQANPGMTFTPRQIADNQVDTVVRTGLSGNNPPAVLQYEGYQQTQDYAKAGQLTDITDWWNKHKDAFSFADNPVVEDACGYEGKIYCMPWDVYSNNQLFYNPDLLSQYDVQLPATIDDLKAIAVKLKGTGITPVSLYGGEGWPTGHWWYSLSIQRCGVDTVNAAAKQAGQTWDAPCFKQAAQDLYDLGKAGVFPLGVEGSDYNAQVSLFLSGKALFMNTGTWFDQAIVEDKPKFDVKAAPFPQVDPAKPSVQILGGINEVFGIPSRAKNTDAAYKFLDYMASKSAGDLFAKASVMNLVKGTDAELPALLQPSWKDVTTALSGSTVNMVTYFENLVPPAVGKVMYTGSASVAAGSMTPDDFVKQVQSAAAAG